MKSIYLSLILLCLGQSVFGFPEMIRHGYVNCVACHVSPSGGGLLTPYGRSISREALSSYGKENEEKFLYGAVSLPEWILAGGDLRALQLFRNNSAVEEAKFIPMQADVEAGLVSNKITAVATAGRAPQNSANPVISRRHYMMYKPTDEWSLRAGRFFPVFGLMLPDHAIVTKRNLGWDQGQESYNLEASYLGEVYNLYVTGIFGRPDDANLIREHGFSVNASVSFLDRFKTGLSFYFGENNSQRKYLYGPFAILGFTSKLYLLTETDLTDKRTFTPEVGQHGFVNFQKLGCELFQGFHIFISDEVAQSDFGNAMSRTDSYGLGIQAFPRPHIEILATWQKQRSFAISPQYGDLAYLLLHYYL